MSETNFSIEKVTEPSEAVYQISIGETIVTLTESQLKKLHQDIGNVIYKNDLKPFIGGGLLPRTPQKDPPNWHNPYKDSPTYTDLEKFHNPPIYDPPTVWYKTTEDSP